MIYTSTVTKTGQIFFPKAVRLALGLEPGQRVMINLENRVAKVERKKTIEEITAEIDKINANASAQSKALVAKNRGKTAGEIREEWLKSDESTKYYEKKYGIKVR